MPDNRQPVAVQIINAFSHLVVQCLVWGAAWYVVAHHEADWMTAFGIAAVLTITGAAELIKGKPPTSGLLLALQSVGKKGLIAALFAAFCLSVSGCGLLSSAPAHMPTIVSAAEALFAEAKKRGVDVDKVPAECEVEWHPPLQVPDDEPTPGRLLMLCELEVK